MLATVKGIFKDGKIELLEAPPFRNESNVVVTFLDQPSKPSGKMMKKGILKGLIHASEEDFKAAEFDEQRALEKWERANRRD